MMNAISTMILVLDMMIIILNTKMLIHLYNAKKGMTKVLLCFLTGYDLGVGLIVLPMRITSLILHPMQLRWPFHQAGCILYGVFSSGIIRATMWTIVGLAVDRVVAVISPFTYSAYKSVRKAYILCSCIAVYAVVMVVIMNTTTSQFRYVERANGTKICVQSFKSVYQANSHHFFLIHRLVEFITSNLVVLVLSVATVIRLRLRTKVSRNIGSSQEMERNMTQMVLVLLGSFLVCYLPFTFYIGITMVPAWIQALGKDLEIKLGQGILTLLTINNLMNPMVYLIFNRGQSQRQVNAEQEMSNKFVRFIHRTSRGKSTKSNDIMINDLAIN